MLLEDEVRMKLGQFIGSRITWSINSDLIFNQETLTNRLNIKFLYYPINMLIQKMVIDN